MPLRRNRCRKRHNARHKKQPMKKYDVLYEKIKREIVTGALPYGGKLPSKRTLAEENGVSVVTAETALDILRSEGYIDSRERSGCFVAYAGSGIFDAVTRAVSPSAPTGSSAPLRLHAEDFANSAATRENAAFTETSADFPFPFSSYAKAARAVLADYGDTLLQKPPRGGSDELKRALRNYLSRSRGMEICESQIVFGAGAEYLYGIITELLGGDKIYGIESPSYGQIEKTYAAKGVPLRLLPLGNDGISSKALNATDANVLHVTPYRSFPTLATAGATKKAEYLRHAQKTDGYIVEDDYRSEFSLVVKPTETLFGADKEGRVLYLNTFSKTLSPALRIAYMLLPPRLAEEYEQRLGFYSCPVPLFEQYVLARLLNDGSFERHINKVRRLLRRS